MFALNEYKQRMAFFKAKYLREDHGDQMMYFNPSDFFDFNENPISDKDWKMAENILRAALKSDGFRKEVHKLLVNYLRTGHSIMKTQKMEPGFSLKK